MICALKRLYEPGEFSTFREPSRGPASFSQPVPGSTEPRPTLPSHLLPSEASQYGVSLEDFKVVQQPILA